MSGISINKRFGFNSFNVIPPAPFVCGDADATAFILNAGITNTIEKQAICQLVEDLKFYSLWTKLKVIYPMVGSSSSSCSYNLKDTTQFQLAFNGGWSFSSLGATPNGINAYADTNLIPAATLPFSIANISMSYYSRTQSSSAYRTDAGCNDNGASAVILRLPCDALNDIYGTDFASTFNLGTSPSGAVNSLAFSTYNKTKSGILTIYHNGLNTNNAVVTAPIRLPKLKVFIGATNNGAILGAGQFGNKQCAWFSMGDTFTSIQNLDLYKTVQNFQTTLLRQV